MHVDCKHLHSAGVPESFVCGGSGGISQEEYQRVMLWGYGDWEFWIDFWGEDGEGARYGWMKDKEVGQCPHKSCMAAVSLRTGISCLDTCPLRKQNQMVLKTLIQEILFKEWMSTPRDKLTFA
jgi:hypothetical protein